MVASPAGQGRIAERADLDGGAAGNRSLCKVHDLTEALERNERLMRELQHRIKNNIAVIRSLLDMRARSASTEEARQDLRVVSERVEALRLVHEHL